MSKYIDDLVYDLLDEEIENMIFALEVLLRERYYERKEQEDKEKYERLEK